MYSNSSMSSCRAGEANRLRAPSHAFRKKEGLSCGCECLLNAFSQLIPCRFKSYRMVFTCPYSCLMVEAQSHFGSQRHSTSQHVLPSPSSIYSDLPFTHHSPKHHMTYPFLLPVLECRRPACDLPFSVESLCASCHIYSPKGHHFVEQENIFRVPPFAKNPASLSTRSIYGCQTYALRKPQHRSTAYERLKIFPSFFHCNAACILSRHGKSSLIT